jgi:hypothetical protein
MWSRGYEQAWRAFCDTRACPLFSGACDERADSTAPTAACGATIRRPTAAPTTLPCRACGEGTGPRPTEMKMFSDLNTPLVFLRKW